MGLIKFIILLVLIYLAVTFWRRLKTQRTGQRRAAPPADTPTLMVRCSRCKVYLPETQALHAGERWYCCKKHLEAEHHD